VLSDVRVPLTAAGLVLLKLQTAWSGNHAPGDEPAGVDAAAGGAASATFEPLCARHDTRREAVVMGAPKGFKATRLLHSRVAFKKFLRAHPLLSGIRWALPPRGIGSQSGYRPGENARRVTAKHYPER
jgi:hypothetical protein